MLNIEMNSLNETMQLFEEARSAALHLVGAIEFAFDPSDPQSVERAIAEGQAKVDAEMADLRSNPFAQKVAEGVKQQIEEVFRSRAERAQNTGNSRVQ
jgi:hypothetical protein